MHVPSNGPRYKKGDRVQERSKKDNREFRTTRRQYVEGPTKYKGGRKYTIVEDPYLSKENGAKRRMWMYKIVQDGTTKVEPKGQNMIILLEE
jgi:hypothetical protein